MDYHRRNRRGRPRSRPRIPVYLARPPKWSVFNGFCSFFVMSGLIAIIYLMLDFHCNNCSKKCDIYNITKGLDDIAQNISNMKCSYSDLEKQIMRFSEELPKMEGQIEILETLANTMERGDWIWNPRTHLPLPDVDVTLNKIQTNNVKIVKDNDTKDKDTKDKDTKDKDTKDKDDLHSNCDVELKQD